MKKGLYRLELYDYSGAIDSFLMCLQVLQERPSPLQAQLRFCVIYIFLVHVLEEVVENPSVDPVTSALTCHVLAQLPLHPRHKLVCTRMAIEKHIAVSNYGSAAKFVKFLLDKNLPDVQKLEEILQMCTVKNKSQDHHPPTTDKVSYHTYKLITGKSYLECNFCGASYELPKEYCVMCRFGKLIERDLS